MGMRFSGHASLLSFQTQQEQTVLGYIYFFSIYTSSVYNSSFGIYTCVWGIAIGLLVFRIGMISEG